MEQISALILINIVEVFVTDICPDNDIFKGSHK